jgi:hypothetical protein
MPQVLDSISPKPTGRLTYSRTQPPDLWPAFADSEALVEFRFDGKPLLVEPLSLPPAQLKVRVMLRVMPLLWSEGRVEDLYASAEAIWFEAKEEGCS